MAKDPSEITYFVVNERSTHNDTPSYAESSKTFLVTKGKLESKVWLDHSAYFPGNTVVAKVETNNTSVKPTNSLKVRTEKSRTCFQSVSIVAVLRCERVALALSEWINVWVLMVAYDSLVPGDSCADS